MFLSQQKVLGVIVYHQLQPHFADPFLFLSPFLLNFKLVGIKLIFAISFPQIILASPLKINHNFLPLLYWVKGEKKDLKRFVIKLITRFNKVIYHESLFHKFDICNKTSFLHTPFCQPRSFNILSEGTKIIIDSLSVQLA